MTVIELWVCNFQGDFFFVRFWDGYDGCFFLGNEKIEDINFLWYQLVSGLY